MVVQRESLLAVEQDYSAKLEDLAVLKTDFTAMVAHELVLPIAAIRTLAAMAHVTTDSPEDHTRALNAIDVEAELLNSLVKDIETVANLEARNSRSSSGRSSSTKSSPRRKRLRRHSLETTR